MTVSFKKFTQFLAASEGVQSPDQLDEIWSSIFAKKQADKDDADDKDKNKVLTAKERLEKKKKEEEERKAGLSKKQADKDDDKDKVLTAKERLEKKKKEEEERKAMLRKKRDDEWAKAKHQVERGTAASLRPSYDRTSRDDYALHRNEAQAAARDYFEDFADWKKAASKLDLSTYDKAWLKAAKGNEDGNLFAGRSVVAKWNPTKGGWITKKVVKEAKESYSDATYWKDDAKAAGFKIKKLLGNMEDGDQTWGAFDGDKKVGEFTEEETGRGGWLIS